MGALTEGLLYALREAWDGIRLRDMPLRDRLLPWAVVGWLWGMALGQLLNVVLS